MIARLKEAVRRLRFIDQNPGFWDDYDLYSRLIVITGMARSGTSAMAAFVGSHPEVCLVIGGGCWDVAENDLIRPDMGESDWETIKELLREQYPRRVLLKQPWLMNRPTFSRAIRPAKVIVCLRERKELLAAWGWGERTGDKCRYEGASVYDENIQHLPRLLRGGATWVYQDKMAESAERIGKYLGLDPAGFDVSRLATRWQDKAEKDWLDKHSVRRERRRP
jgi:hypothetical protein